MWCDNWDYIGSMKTVCILMYALCMFSSNISCSPIHSYMLKPLGLCLYKIFPRVQNSELYSHMLKLVFFCKRSKWWNCLHIQTLKEIEGSLKTYFPCSNVHFIMTKESYFRYEILVPRSFQVNATFLQFHLPDTIAGCFRVKLTIVSTIVEFIFY